MVKIRRKKSRSALKACLPIIVLVILGLAWISNTPLSRTLYKDLVEAASGAGTSETKDDTPFPNLKRLNQELLSTFITNTTSVWEAELLQRLDRIRERCGELCTINDAAALDKYTVNEWNASSPFLRQMEVPFDCNTLMMDEELDKSDRLIPRYPPKVLEPYYTLNGLAGIHHKMYFNQTYLDTNASNPLWTVAIPKASGAIQGRLSGFLGRESSSHSRDLEKASCGGDSAPSSGDLWILPLQCRGKYGVRL